MDKITVHAILLQYGKWIEREQFVELVAKKREVKERQAYNLIKAAYESRDEMQKIKKHIYQDGTTEYGLPEFGPLTPIVQQENKPLNNYMQSLLQRSWKVRERVRVLLSQGYYELEQAWDITQTFIQTFPSSSGKERLIKQVRTVNEKVKETEGLGSDDVLRDCVLQVWNEIFEVLKTQP